MVDKDPMLLVTAIIDLLDIFRKVFGWYQKVSYKILNQLNSFFLIPKIS